MPEQPPTPSKIEELLRASAQRRRAEFDRAESGDGELVAATKMPTAMRRRLHEEILARADASESAETRAENNPSEPPRARPWTLLLTHFWPRFALAAAVVVALIAVPFVWQASRSPWKIAAQSRLAGTTTAPAPVSELTLNSAPAVALTPPPPAIVAAAPRNGATPGVSSVPEPAAPGLAAAAKPSVTLAEKDAPASHPAEGQLQASGEAGLRQSFARNETAVSRAKTAAGTANLDGVLSNFRIEQTGDRVRIVDADGSVYTGEIQPLVATAAAAPESRARVRAAAPPQAAAAPSGRTTQSAADRQLLATAPAAKRAAPATSSQAPTATAPGGGPAPAPAPRPTDSVATATTPGNQAPAQNSSALTERSGVAGAAAGSAAFSFRASGANVSLRKPVIFEGTYYPALTQAGEPNAEPRLELKKKEDRGRAIGPAQTAQQSRARADDESAGDGTAAADAPRVIGRARVADREVPVDASAVAP